MHKHSKNSANQETVFVQGLKKWIRDLIDTVYMKHRVTFLYTFFYIDSFLALLQREYLKWTSILTKPAWIGFNLCQQINKSQSIIEKESCR